MTRNASGEVLVLGAGPAGCAAATLLAHWGHDVVLIGKPAGTAAPLAESIPPSSGKLFDVLGLSEAIDGAGFIRSTGNTVWWGGDSPRVELFPNGRRGWQVTTDRLAALMQKSLPAATRLRVEYRRSDDADIAERHPAFTLDCTGRAGLVARRRGLRVLEPGARTIALVGVWRRLNGEWPVPDATHTVIESYDDGWAWSVPATAEERHVAVMVDPRASGLARDAVAREVYLHELGKTDGLASLLRDATMSDGPFGWDASTYRAARYVDESVLLVGDAGSFIDPLSSAGVKKALASGWLAAVAVHTALRRPLLREVALQFFADREAEVYASFKALTGRFLAAAAAGHHHPFWDDRVEDVAPAPSMSSVAAAFDDLRERSHFRVARNPEATIVQRPAISGCEIVLEDRLVSREQPTGVRHAFDVDLLTLVELAPSCTSVPELLERYHRHCAPVALPNFLRGLSLAIAEKWLLWM